MNAALAKVTNIKDIATIKDIIATKAAPHLIDWAKEKDKNKTERTKAKMECKAAIWTKGIEKAINKDTLDGEAINAILNNQELTAEEKESLLSNLSVTHHEKKKDENEKCAIFFKGTGSIVTLGGIIYISKKGLDTLNTFAKEGAKCYKSHDRHKTFITVISTIAEKLPHR